MSTPYVIAEAGVNFFDTARVRGVTPLEEAKKYVLSLRGQVNKELSAQNRIDAVELQEEDFERTATQKIKRFLYPKKKKEDGQ